MLQVEHIYVTGLRFVSYFIVAVVQQLAKYPIFSLNQFLVLLSISVAMSVRICVCVNLYVPPNAMEWRLLVKDYF